MKAIINTGPGCLEWCERPDPRPGPGRVRIRTAACGICATDLEMIAGWPRTPFGAIPGHEWAGVVDAVGDGVATSLLGQPCVAENVFADGGEVGFEYPGGYAERFLTEARLVQRLPAGFPLVLATLIEPLAVAVRALRRLRLDDRAAALVMGDGPLGLLLTALLRRDRVGRVALIGGRPARLAVARELGATETLDYHGLPEGSGRGAAIRERLGADWPNVIEASGSAAALAVGRDLLARGGKLLVVGDYGKARADFPWNDLLHRELELIGSNASAGAWPEAVRLATAGDLPLQRLLTHRLPADRFAEAVAVVRDRGQDAIKVVIEWPNRPCEGV